MAGTREAETAMMCYPDCLSSKSRPSGRRIPSPQFQGLQDGIDDLFNICCWMSSVRWGQMEWGRGRRIEVLRVVKWSVTIDGNAKKETVWGFASSKRCVALSSHSPMPRLKSFSEPMYVSPSPVSSRRIVRRHWWAKSGSWQNLSWSLKSNDGHAESQSEQARCRAVGTVYII